MTIPPTPPGGDVSAPVCPRHPDRESYVRCQRCERPVCVECQRQAVVGVQCVDCARQGAAQVRTGRTVFGGARTDGRPVVSWTIIGLCLVLNLLQRVPGLDVTGEFAFAPALGGLEPWRYLSAAFLHDAGPLPYGVLHIAFNMYALWLVGPYLERLFGRARFLALYLICALGGSVAFQLLTPDFSSGGAVQSVVGASGAVFGLFGALVVVQRRLRLSLGQIGVVLGINLVIGFVVAGIAWQAHLGGLLTGVVAAAVLAYAPRERRDLVQWGGLALLTVLLVVLAVFSLEG